MANWFTKLFERAPKPPRIVDYGKADVKVIVNDGRTFYVELKGEHWYTWDNDDCGLTGRAAFKRWCDRNGETGTVSVGNGLFIPLCNIHTIKVEYSKHEVKVPG